MTRKSETPGYLLELLIDYSERAFLAGNDYAFADSQALDDMYPTKEQYLSTLRKDLVDRGISVKKRKGKK